MQFRASPSALKGDKHGGYEPTSEIFSLKNKQKARQVRRLRSLLRALKSYTLTTTQTEHSHQQQLQNEWNKICSAKGYGNKWSNWILGFEVVPYVPLLVPDYASLELMCQITVQDCEASCHQESLRRQKFFRHKVQVDCDDNYSQMSYKIIKNKTQATLDEIPVTYTTKGYLHRCAKNDNTIKLEECLPLIPQCKITFGAAEIQVLSYCYPMVSFRVLQGMVPTEGTVKFKQIGILSGEIFHAFRSFWSPMWLRDSVDDQFQDANWESFEKELDTIPLPNIPVDFSLNDPDLWKEVITSLKNKKAHGCCAWRHEELKLLPSEAIRDLAYIFSQITLIGMSPASMTARTILLSKIPLPESMHHGRPITILSVLYRLVGKVIFKKIAQSWSKFLPFSISGGLPHRGVKDIAVAQKLCIEQALKSKSQLGGFSLDLIKAFNTFPRRPLAMVMKKMGLPNWIISFWLNSLACMTRYLDHAGIIHGPIPCTTGVPEGDALSVLSMISLSACFYYRLADEHTWPYAYADNWSWLTCSQKAHFRAYIKMLNLVSSLNLQIDFRKSWHWGISKNFRQFCETFGCLFPHEDHRVIVKHAVKDLGEMVHYQKSMGLGFIKDKIQEAITRAHRLEFLPLSIQTKAKIIQSAIWTVGLYSADTVYLGSKHFQDLRRAATQAILGKSKQASPWLTCFSLSSYLTDPFLHVILGILRTMRRLYQIQPVLARDLIQMACDYNGSRPYGPASVFKVYMTQLGWEIKPDGKFVGPDHFQVSVFHHSTNEIVKIFREFWPIYLVQQLQRKGIGDFPLHPTITFKVFQHFDDRDQKLLLTTMLGAFQSEAQKALWDNKCEGTCVLCGLHDTHGHRVFECEYLQQIRSQHKEALEILKHLRPEWVYLPVARIHPECIVLRAIVHSPHVDKPSITQKIEGFNELKLFTDGGCIFPTDVFARIATWAVVQEINIPSSHKKPIIDSFVNKTDQEDLWSPAHKVLGMGPVEGNQTAGRGELQAMVLAVEEISKQNPVPSARFITDSQYVCDLISLISCDMLIPDYCKSANGDLIGRLRAAWIKDQFHVQKIRSHQKITHHEEMKISWDKIGNACADYTASKAMVHLPSPIRHLSHQIASFHSTEKMNLLKVLKFFVDHNRLRAQLIQNHIVTPLRFSESQTTAIPTGNHFGMTSQAMGIDAYKILSDFNPVYNKSFNTDIPDEHFECVLQGSNVAKAVSEWAQLLRWPDNADETYQNDADWGISWFELLISFCLATRHFFPIRIQGLGGGSVYTDYESSGALLCHPSKRAAFNQAWCLQKTIQNIQSISDQVIFPRFISEKFLKCKSLARLGFNAKHSGIPCRPWLPNNSLTMQVVWKYLHALSYKQGLDRPIVLPPGEPLVHFEKIPSLTAKERYCRYLKRIKQLRKRPNQA